MTLPDGTKVKFDYLVGILTESAALDGYVLSDAPIVLQRGPDGEARLVARIVKA